MATNYSPTIVTDGAVFVGDALMPSTATSATKLYNRAGSSSDGTMFTGACCDFDGTDDDIFTTSDLTLSGAFAISVWVKGDGSSFGGGWVISNKAGGPVNLAMRLVNPGSGIKLQYYYYSGAWRSIYSTATVAANVWTHLVLSRSVGNYVSLYIDGELDSTTQAEDAGGVTGNTVNGPVNVVGGYWSTGVFSGTMADFKVFNTALSSTQVKQMYDDSKVIIPAGIEFSDLDLWYSMAEGTGGAGTVVYDGSGNKNSGVGQNFNSDEFLTAQTGCPQLITGYNRPMWFSNAGSDYVQVASDGSSTFASQNYTIAAWINPAVGPPGADRAIFSYDFTSHANPYYSIHVRLLSDGKVFFSWNDGSTYRDLQTTGDITASNTWVHIACTHTSGSQKIYINGVLNNSSTRTDTIAFYNQEVWIGRANYGAYFDGIINEVVLYDSVLTLAQVQTLAATGPNGGPLPPDPMSLSNSSNVVGYWRNDGNTTWTDRSSNSNNGTVYGSPSALLFKEGYNGSKNVNTGRDHQGFPLFHKNVGAMGFEPHNYVDVGSLGTSGEFSSCAISLWMRKGAQIDNYGNLFDCNFGATTANKGPRMEVDIGGSIVRVYMGTDGGSYTSISFGSLSNDVWYNLVLTVRPNGTGQDLKAYTNGALITASTSSASFLWDGDMADLYLGVGFTVARYFTGDIANFQIYNRALSRPEILQNYNAQKSRFI